MMLISFKIENWMSFRDEASLSMIATRERQHGDRLPKVPKYQTRILPVAAMYGGNASGKTNLFKAIKFSKQLIVQGTKPEGLIPVERFKLNDTSQNSPATFSFEILIDETIYEFMFAVTNKLVIEEKLVKISSKEERTLYHRKNDKISFDEKLTKNQFLNFAFQGTRDNQLFLTNSVSQKVDTFKPVHDWFNNTLALIAPDAQFSSIELFSDTNDSLHQSINEALSHLDTGICRYGWVDIHFESITLPPGLKNQIEEHLNENAKAITLQGPHNERFIFTRTNEEIHAKQLVTFHKSTSGETKFELSEESGGSQRVLDILPAFIELNTHATEKVFIIDELDRSLHTRLTRSLLNRYLNSCTHKSRSQLLFTTHDAMLMDQELFRRDEMWITERDETGASTIVSFSDFKDIRYDKDIRKSYLQGRFGGVPNIALLR